MQNGTRAPHPTIIVATTRPQERLWLVRSLGESNYLVLEAGSVDEALQFARFHSRPIQVLLMQSNLAKDGLTELIRRLRPDMQILMLESDGEGSEHFSNATLAKARRVLSPIKCNVAKSA